MRSPPIASRPASAARRPERGWAPVLVASSGVALVVIGPAVAPSLGWRRRLGWRGRLRLALVQTVWGTVARQWVIPPARRLRAEALALHRHAHADLVASLGREPTSEELDARLLVLLRARVQDDG